MIFLYISFQAFEFWNNKLTTFYLTFQALELCYVTVEVATIGEDSLGDKVVR